MAIKVPRARVRTLSTLGELGSFAGTGGSVELLGNWEPGNDPELVSQQMLQLAGNLEDTEEPLLQIASMASEDTARRFETETDPDGFQWEPLVENTIKFKERKGYPADILQATEALKDWATSEEPWIVEGGSLVFDPSGMPADQHGFQYGRVHQTGTGIHRVSSALSRAGRLDVLKDVRRGEMAREARGEKRPPGGNLPQREFIGMSDEFIEEAGFYLDEYYEGLIDEALSENRVYVHPGGTVQIRLPSGRFGPKGLGF